MDDKEIFEFIDNLDHKESTELNNEIYTETLDNEEVDDDIKSKIKQKLYLKIQDENNKTKVNTKVNTTNKTVKDKKTRIIKIIGGVIAAMITFVVTVNLFPNVAYALEKIPVVDVLVKFSRITKPYYFDKGFNKLIEEGQYQEINKTFKKNGFKFTVNAIVGDGSKLWISYDYTDDVGVIGQPRFYDENNNELIWKSIVNKDVIELDTNGVLDSFTIVVPVYKNTQELKDAVESVLNESIGKSQKEVDETINKNIEKYKLCTLNIPINIDKNIFKDSIVKENQINKTINTEIGDLTVEKLQSSLSRTKVYFKINNPNICKLYFESFHMVDENTNEYFYPAYDYLYYDVEQNPNEIIVELKGGITDISNLRLVIGKIKYINKEDKYVQLDLEKKELEKNNFGINLISINDNNIILSSQDPRIQFVATSDGYPLAFDTNFESTSQKITTFVLKRETSKEKNKVITLEVFNSEKFNINGCNIIISK